MRPHPDLVSEYSQVQLRCVPYLINQDACVRQPDLLLPYNLHLARHCHDQDPLSQSAKPEKVLVK